MSQQRVYAERMHTYTAPSGVKVTSTQPEPSDTVWDTNPVAFWFLSANLWRGKIVKGVRLLLADRKGEKC